MILEIWHVPKPKSFVFLDFKDLACADAQIFEFHVLKEFKNLACAEIEIFRFQRP